MKSESVSLRERQLFLSALEHERGDARRAFLDGACEGEPGLRLRLESLLRNHDATGALDQTAIESVFEASIQEGPGAVLGRYKLLEKIGEGGFGLVYMAEQREPVRRRVALKFIKWGMDTKQVIGRFESERQALALMDHPNIAKVFDAGSTENGRPYFVMELVRGIPITQYCDQNALSTRERLELFVPVCKAIQHAHTRGVIHRDIKPSNVLVSIHDGVPVPKVIDFGIAKATHQRLTEKTIFTQFQQFIGTPAYMSPEQAGSGVIDVDIRTDVYSLGILLYELLTSRTPFDVEDALSHGLDELRRFIRETDLVKPSTRVRELTNEELHTAASKRKIHAEKLDGAIRGELDWIVMKAIDKDRNRRYDSANDFANDIACHLNRDPVSAAAPTLIYQLRKLVQKHRRAIGALTAVFLLMAVATASTTYWAIRATKAEDLADERAETEADLREKAEIQTALALKREQETRALTVEMMTRRAERALEEGDAPTALETYAQWIRFDPTHVRPVAQAMRLLTQEKFILPEIRELPLENAPSVGERAWKEWKPSPTNQYIAAVYPESSGDGQTLSLWKSSDGSQIVSETLDPGFEFSLPTFAADESYVAVFSGPSGAAQGGDVGSQTLRVLSLPSGELVWERSVGNNLWGDLSARWSFATLDPVNNVLLAAHRSGGGSSAQVSAMDLQTGETVWEQEYPFRVGAFDGAANKNWLAVYSGADGGASGVAPELRVFRVADGEFRVFEDLVDFNESIRDLQFLGDGSILMFQTSESSGAAPSIRFLDVSAGEVKMSLPGWSPVVSPDGGRVYVRNHEALECYDASTLRLIHRVPSPGEGALRVSNDGRTLLDHLTPRDAWSLYPISQPLTAFTGWFDANVAVGATKIEELIEDRPTQTLRQVVYNVDHSSPTRHFPFVRHDNGVERDMIMGSSSSVVFTTTAPNQVDVRVSEAEFSADGGTVFSKPGRLYPEAKIREFDTATLDLLRETPLPMASEVLPQRGNWYRFDLRPGDEFALVWGGGLNAAFRAFSVNSWEEVMQLPESAARRPVASNANGAIRVALDGRNTRFTVTDLGRRQVFHIPYAPEDYTGARRVNVYCSNSGDYLLTTTMGPGSNTDCDVWSVPERRILHTLHADQGRIWFLPDNEHILAVNGATASIYNIASGEMVFEPWIRPEGHASRFQLHPDKPEIRAEGVNIIWRYETHEFESIAETPAPMTPGSQFDRSVPDFGSAAFYLAQGQTTEHPDGERNLQWIGGPAMRDSMTTLTHLKVPPMPAPPWLADAIDQVLNESKKGLEAIHAGIVDVDDYSKWLEWMLADAHSRNAQFDAIWSREKLLDELKNEDNVIHLLFATELSSSKDPVLMAKLAFRLAQVESSAYQTPNLPGLVTALIRDAVWSAPESVEVRELSLKIDELRSSRP